MHARLTAKYLRRFLPGNPRTVVVSKVGVSGTVGANFVYASKPDGLTIGSFSNVPPLDTVFGEGVNYDPGKFVPLLSFRESQLHEWWIIGTAPYSTLDEAVGQGSKGGPTFTVGNELACSSQTLGYRAAKDWLDLPLEIILGLPGSRTNVMTHLERGDVDSQSSTMWFTLPRDRPGWLKDGFVKAFAVRAGQTKIIGPNDPLPGNGELTSEQTPPYVIDLLQDPEQKRLWDLFTSDYGPTFRTIQAPPGTPDDITELLREATWKMVNDEDFRADYAKFFAGEEVTPTRGDELAEYVIEKAKGVDEVVKWAKKYVPECGF